MSDLSAAQVIAEGLDGKWGWIGPDVAMGLADAALAALAADRFAVVKLPEADKGVWYTADGEDLWVRDLDVGHDYGDMSDTPAVFRSPSQARSLAAALLAAANAAEAGR